MEDKLPSLDLTRVFVDHPVEGGIKSGDLYIQSDGNICSYAVGSSQDDQVAVKYNLALLSACLVSDDNGASYSSFSSRELEVNRTVYVNTAGGL